MCNYEEIEEFLCSETLRVIEDGKFQNKDQVVGVVFNRYVLVSTQAKWPQVTSRGHIHKLPELSKAFDSGIERAFEHKIRPNHLTELAKLNQQVIKLVRKANYGK